MKKYRDYYFCKAKEEKYPARSVYKLQELDAKFHLFKKGMKVLDLGAAPGSWSLWAAEQVGASGQVLACDLHLTTTFFPPQVLFLQEDVFARSENFKLKLQTFAPFDLVMSDMAPATTGVACTDQARSFNLAQEAFWLACDCLKKESNFVAKVFMGPDVPNLLNSMRTTFKQVRTFKPKSSRSESKETFVVGLYFN